MSIPVDIKRLLKLKKDYPWPKPDQCSNCKNPNLWGHGFVDAFFDCEKDALPLKRYRCPNCNSVIKLKPEGYFSRFHATIDTIRKSITSLADHGKKDGHRGRGPGTDQVGKLISGQLPESHT